MKRDKIEKCIDCGEGLSHNRDMVFFELKVTQHILDMNVIRREHGLEEMMGGNVALARAFSTDEDISKELEEVRMLICTECFYKTDVPSWVEKKNGENESDEQI